MKIHLDIGTRIMPAASVSDDGVLRWDSNGRVPFDDMVQVAIAAGHPVDRAACTLARDADNRAFLAEYRKRDRAPDAEQLAEMRNAFGTGTTVVNVITGRRTRL